MGDLIEVCSHFDSLSVDSSRSHKRSPSQPRGSKRPIVRLSHHLDTYLSF